MRDHNKLRAFQLADEIALLVCAAPFPLPPNAHPPAAQS
jgi:hypothetical protein